MKRAILAIVLVGCCGVFCSCDRPAETEPVAETTQAPPEPVLCRVELRSFIVAGRGRHLYLLIDCPEGYDEFDGRVEYSTAAHRTDYTAPTDRSGAARVAKMSAGHPLYPIIENADDRFEAEFEITLEQAICLQQDRVFSARYALLGTNSSSGLRGAVELCDCELPEQIVNAGGMFGDYPGIDHDPGRVIDRELWPAFGIEGEDEILPPADDFRPAPDTL